MVLMYASLFLRCSICIVSWMGPKEYVCSIKCLAKLEFWLFVLITALCSLNLAKNFCRFAPHMPYCGRGKLAYKHRISCIYLFCSLTVCCACVFFGWS